MTLVLCRMTSVHAFCLPANKTERYSFLAVTLSAGETNEDEWNYFSRTRLFITLPCRALGGWALPSPSGGDTSVAVGTGSGSSRSHFCSIFYHSRSGDKRLRSAACCRSFLSSFPGERNCKCHNWRRSDLSNVNGKVMYELRKMD